MSLLFSLQNQISLSSLPRFRFHAAVVLNRWVRRVLLAGAVVNVATFDVLRRGWSLRGVGDNGVATLFSSPVWWTRFLLRRRGLLFMAFQISFPFSTGFLKHEASMAALSSMVLAFFPARLA